MILINIIFKPTQLFGVLTCYRDLFMFSKILRIKFFLILFFIIFNANTATATDRIYCIFDGYRIAPFPEHCAKTPIGAMATLCTGDSTPRYCEVHSAGQCKSGSGPGTACPEDDWIQRKNWNQPVIPVNCSPNANNSLNEACNSDEPDEDDGCSKNGEGNPCNVATGNKYQIERDITGSLGLTRYYNSRNLAKLGIGKGWRHNYQRRLLRGWDEQAQHRTMIHVSSSGRGEPWKMINGIWVGEADSKISITEVSGVYTLTKADGTVEKYNRIGALTSVTTPSGEVTTLIYNDQKKLAQVKNHYGQTLTFNYADYRIASITDSLNNTVKYEYDTNGNLVTVIYPDATAGDDTDNPRKIYHYENVNFPNHLTGITDENGDRYSTYAYDATGKAISTEHSQTTNAVGQERFEFNFEGGSQL